MTQISQSQKIKINQNSNPATFTINISVKVLSSRLRIIFIVEFKVGKKNLQNGFKYMLSTSTNPDFIQGPASITVVSYYA